jgi:hypothetical protein
MSTISERWRATYPPAMYGIMLGMAAYGAMLRFGGETGSLVPIFGSLLSGLVCTFRREQPGPVGNPFYYQTRSLKVFFYSLVTFIFCGLGFGAGMLILEGFRQIAAAFRPYLL